MTVGRPSPKKSLAPGVEMDAEIAKRVYGHTAREVKDLIRRKCLMPYSTDRGQAARLLKHFWWLERGAGDPAVAPAMVERFNRYLAERSAKALAAGSFIRIAVGCCKPINVCRAALYAVTPEKPRRARRQA